LNQVPSHNALTVNPISIQNEIDQLTGDFGQSEQHDAHEFLANLLDFLMEEDLKTIKQS
jgi:ubiquitin C-terminal hydrolase